MKVNKIGRPMKYKQILENLDDNAVYTAAMVAETASQLNMLSEDPVERQKEKKLIRHTMVRLTQNHKFPRPGDEIVKLKKQRARNGWYGWRWKRSMEGKPKPTS